MLIVLVIRKAKLPFLSTYGKRHATFLKDRIYIVLTRINIIVDSIWEFAATGQKGNLRYEKKHVVKRGLLNLRAPFSF
ncbi:hypothetical protein DKG77_02860 [Flagellimonas aquimarina]|uniref:Uncharacterized protein n=1 Tax=Flagellimonas aquimarina TaxID=2201895 RepID=A0A316KZW2_9FLAO|nr:hypothetical protein DKG77_02860 [Allomuricauda koreensis]